jgi:hypothetical protein
MMDLVLVPQQGYLRAQRRDLRASSPVLGASDFDFEGSCSMNMSKMSSCIVLLRKTDLFPFVAARVPDGRAKRMKHGRLWEIFC